MRWRVVGSSVAPLSRASETSWEKLFSNRALESGVRTDAGPTAPACGLYLLRVLYREPVLSGNDHGPYGVPGAFQY